MKPCTFELDDYEANQFKENPQLFETNLFERFPQYTQYKITEQRLDDSFKIKCVVYFD